MKVVFDAYPLLAWMQQEEGAQLIEDILLEAEKKRAEPIISAINVGEVYYRLKKSGKETQAENFLQDIGRDIFPLRLIPANNKRVWAAARIKALYPIAYADAFAAALAMEFDIPLLTGDPEFRILERDGMIRVKWLGQE